MADVLIENPILNSPYKQPTRHYRFSATGITDQTDEGRRESTYIAPVPAPKGKAVGQQLLPGFNEEPKPNRFVNELRANVDVWRRGDYAGISATTRRLLDYWTDPSRENHFFFCQVEALETAIYIAEVSGHFNDPVERQLREMNSLYNSELFRVAFKMATGSGKTVVMAMLIAWQVLNKRANPHSSRFTNRFLIVTPGITIKDRLRVLIPNDPDNYYRLRDIVPPDLMMHMNSARIAIVNFHQFRQRDLIEASSTTKQILRQGRAHNPFIETPDQMVARVCSTFGTKGEIIVINDEAHHCYQGRSQNGKGVKEKLDKYDKQEVKKQQEDARLWFDGLQAVQSRLGIKVVYDLSATPFFLRGSGYGEGTIFPWVVSDFSLVDAIESGIVKIPRVPITDNAEDENGPVNRFLWANVRDKLPSPQNKAKQPTDEPILPEELEQALWSLYDDYDKRYQHWATHKTSMPPVMIVVCNNTAVSSLVYRYIAGWERKNQNDILFLEHGQLPLFDNVSKDGSWYARPNTILVDSQQLESGEGLGDDFKRVAATEIDAFKEEYRRRYPEKSVENISDSDLLREVLNTVGKPRKLGEHIRCVVSVSMLTEGWDANNVTHILGVRAFSTQLICEQVVGRGLRRMSYELNERGLLTEEYAEIYGVPFAFIPCSGRALEDTPGKPVYYVQTEPSRSHARISFPRVVGYRYEAPDGMLIPKFTDGSRVILTPEDFPTRTLMAGVAGQESLHTLQLSTKRLQELQYEIARRVLEIAFIDEDGTLHVWRFPEILNVVRQWFSSGYLVLKDATSIDMLQISEKRTEVVHAIIDAIRQGEILERQETIAPILATDSSIGTTEGIAFNTIRPSRLTGEKCHLNYDVFDTYQWEQKVVESLENMPEVERYVKNYRLGFAIPYTYRNVARSYTPDFIAVMTDGLNLIIEVTGERREDKVAKVRTIESLWIPAVNNHGGFGRWGFVEISDPFLTEKTIRAYIRGETPTTEKFL
jgi:type III restriction enzyme